MGKDKGQSGMPIEIIVGLIFSLLIAGIVLLMVVPLIRSTEDAAGCLGLLRHIASYLANTIGVEIC